MLCCRCPTGPCRKGHPLPSCGRPRTCRRAHSVPAPKTGHSDLQSGRGIGSRSLWIRQSSWSASAERRDPGFGRRCPDNVSSTWQPKHGWCIPVWSCLPGSSRYSCQQS